MGGTRQRKPSSFHNSSSRYENFWFSFLFPALHTVTESFDVAVVASFFVSFPEKIEFLSS